MNANLHIPEDFWNFKHQHFPRYPVAFSNFSRKHDYFIIRHSSIRHSSIRHSSIRHSSIRHSSIRHSSIRHSSIPHFNQISVHAFLIDWGTINVLWD